jgi:hypothetical protein
MVNVPYHLKTILIGEKRHRTQNTVAYSRNGHLYQWSDVTELMSKEKECFFAQFSSISFS